jgi:hypothetical protein
MRILAKSLMFASALVCAATAASAEPYGVGKVTYHVRHFVGHWRGRRMVGPVYGWPGQPLGPAYHMRLWMPDPRLCGPGLCQDDPWY